MESISSLSSLVTIIVYLLQLASVLPQPLLKLSLAAVVPSAADLLAESSLLKWNHQLFAHTQSWYQSAQSIDRLE